ncbi:hypothetical protein A3K29_02610 [Candidatus Collierbacteria bacterium RIFOXYB2_FULL_46_14]|nr:MAG: hypothetical protein A3K29_02610 [Candidatus Collierbacteria bacterium RIFOXYB2_FULL_46_14]OGD76053.1 MAG: hypothetical protein A3K43_02610 [Candidatus Collierbacteria bacterium RIFOXYA2_FULL_46_20]OGD77389.1 MAG: hypothetical protein A3K39_02610 [Candidatus Collierbacteria bacterium RIFOXYC2_FULL_43_15]OGD80679.1 MAG: hypothetical protein A2320_03105 [Pseudomonadales bacterium GWC2_63_15]OGD82111.1 MAG: hypothetical protein A3K36_02610 [Candidatus Collierbacteria bacterium RIFOXYD2_FUL
MKTSIKLIAVPDDACLVERLDLRVLMSKALKIEERLRKGVNPDDEQRRYHILCDRMEYLGSFIGMNKSVRSVELGIEYFELLLQIQARFPVEFRSARVSANFCPWSKITEQISLFENLVKRAGVSDRKEIQEKIRFYRDAEKNKLHILELQEQLITEDAEVNPEDGLISKFLSIPVSDKITSAKDVNSFMALRNQINTVIADMEKGIQTGVNFSDLAHNVITEILREFVYQGGRPMYLPVIYADGSKGKPLPIRCLKFRSEKLKALSKHPILNVGMMSGRHHEMDEVVKVYFFRNQEISIGKTAAESDEAAYVRAKEIFEKLRSEGIYRIAFFQTGFQPAVVGFYRALTEELLKREKSAPELEVIPHYYFGEEYEEGRVWS